MKKLKSLISRIFKRSPIVELEVTILTKNNNHGKTLEAFKVLSEKSKIHLLIMLLGALEAQSLIEIIKRMSSVKEKA